MLRCLPGLCAAFALTIATAAPAAPQPPGLAVTVDVRHVAADLWRVDYRFAHAVTAMRFDSEGDYRPAAWKVITPSMRLAKEGESDLISAGGKPFTQASVEISTYRHQRQKAYAPFNRFTDGGTAMFLGHLQGEVRRGPGEEPMLADIRVAGLGAEHVIAPPLNKAQPGGARGYAYFGPAQPVRQGAARFVFDPQTPDWMRETVVDAGARLAGYYEKAYGKPLPEAPLILVAMMGFESPGMSMNGGAVLGQLAYRFEGKQLLGDHPKKRELLTKLVAHELAHLWQMNIERGGVGGQDPWIHEGGAEAMALDALLQTGAWSPEQVAAYRAAQTATCDKLGGSVASYEGIYACGLVRFDKLGVAIVPLWRALIEASGTGGEVFSDKMVGAAAQAVAAAHGTAQAAARQP